jgi:pimeloyl-ACP methyl ester carboxylesterase
MQEIEIDNQKIECKTKIIWGIHDKVYPDPNLKKYKKHLKHAEVHFVDGGHSLPRNNPTLIKPHLK